MVHHLQDCTWQEQVLDTEGVEQRGGQHAPQGIQSQFRQGPGWRKGQGHSDCLTVLQHHSHSVSYSILQKTELPYQRFVLQSAESENHGSMTL